MLPDALSFRPVRPEDKERVIAFTLNTWGDDEDDYIKDVFDEWIADPRGEFTAAVIDGKVVGIAKLTDRGDAEWWLEGLRIDPAWRRQGIAREFNRYHLELVKTAGGSVVRYMAGGENAGSQTIGARAGFLHIITYRAYLAEASDEFPQPTLLSFDDAPLLLRWINSPLMGYLHGVYRDGWSAKTLTAAELQRVVEAKLVYGLKDTQGNLTKRHEHPARLARAPVHDQRLPDERVVGLRGLVGRDAPRERLSAHAGKRGQEPGGGRDGAARGSLRVENRGSGGGGNAGRKDRHKAEA